MLFCCFLWRTREKRRRVLAALAVGERLVLGLAGARNVLGSPTTVSVASAGSRSAPNTTALQLVRVAPCGLGAGSETPEIASTIALMYSQRLDCFLDNQKALTVPNTACQLGRQSLSCHLGAARRERRKCLASVLRGCSTASNSLLLHGSGLDARLGSFSSQADSGLRHSWDFSYAGVSRPWSLPVFARAIW